MRSEWCSVKASPTVHYIIISLFVQNNNKPVLRVKSGLVLAGVRTSSNCQVTPHHPSVSLSQLSHSISICDCFISDWCGAAAVDTVKYFTTTFLQPWKIFNRVGYNFTNIYISERERSAEHTITTKSQYDNMKWVCAKTLSWFVTIYLLVLAWLLRDSCFLQWSEYFA